MLHAVLALDRNPNVPVILKVDKAFDGVLLCKSCNETVPMFVHSPNKVIGDPDIKDTVRCTRQNINIAA